MDAPVPATSPDPLEQRRRDARRLRHAALASMAFVAVLWWIKLFEMWLGGFSGLTLRPGEPTGLIGIITAPLLHGSVGHLVANSLPLLVLGTLALAVYPRASLRALPVIWLLSGVGVWLFGRPPSHLGASGLSHGLMFFLFLLGLLRRDRAAIGAAMIAYFLYGGMLMTIFPREVGISWEYHLFGALAGGICAIWLRGADPALPRKRYSWEDDESEDDENQDGAAPDADSLEPPRPADVPVLWQRPSADERGKVLPFRRRDNGDQEESPRD